MVRQTIYPGCCVTASVSKPRNRDVGMEIEERHGRFYVTKVGAIFTRNEIPLEEGDKILTLNGKAYDEYSSIYELTSELKAAERITMVVMRRDPYASDSSASTNDEQMVLYDQDMMDEEDDGHHRARGHRPNRDEALAIEGGPSSAYDIRPGDMMQLHSLRAKPEFNGARVTIIKQDEQNGRWQVQHVETNELLSVSPDNLAPMQKASRRSRPPPREPVHDEYDEEDEEEDMGPFKLGSVMKLHGLKTKPEMNGKFVKVLEEDTTKHGRWNVQLMNSPTVISVSEINLIPTTN